MDSKLESAAAGKSDEMTSCNYKLTLQFDGAGFSGWQRQPVQRTVQADLERAIAETVAQPVNVRGCGRTDAGVHARAYVANFKAVSKLPPDRLHLAINSRLNDDVVVTKCEIVPDDFDARLDALAKVYRYTTVYGPIRPTLERGLVNYCSRALDVEPMKAAATFLVGEHDFAAFVNKLEPGKNTVRTIHAVDVEQTDDNTITMTFTGGGFMYNMVRIMAGTLLEIGRGKYPPDWAGEVLVARDRSAAGPTAPAKGLMLVRVIYGQM